MATQAELEVLHGYGAREVSTMIKLQTIHWKWIAGLVLLLAISRLIPHPPNFTPLGAMAILAGATIKDLRLAFLVPLVAMLLSDALLGFHSSMLYVYAAVVLMVIMNRYLLLSISFTILGLAALFSAILFFGITNFGAWMSHDMYPRTLNGLGQAYVAGIPFFRNTLLGNLFFTAISFYMLTLAAKNKVIRA